MPPSTGLVALLFADLEKSSTGLELFGDAFRDAIRRLHDIGVIFAEQHGGRYINHTGDGFFLAFPSPLSAVLCACDLQSTLLGGEWGRHYPLLRLRIGIHTGAVSMHNGQYDGLPVW